METSGLSQLIRLVHSLFLSFPMEGLPRQTRDTFFILPVCTHSGLTGLRQSMYRVLYTGDKWAVRDQKGFQEIPAQLHSHTSQLGYGGQDSFEEEREI